MAGIIFTGLFLSSSAFAQSSSSSYRLDYERTTSDAGTKQSSSYNLIGAITSISAEGESVSYNLRNVYSGMPAVTAICGNGIIEAGEQCDGVNFGGLTCSNFGYSHGNLQCVSCMIVTSGCYNITGGGGGFILPPKQDEEEVEEEEIEEEIELTFEVEIEKREPYEIGLRPSAPVQPIPVFKLEESAPALRPIAPDEYENYRYHFEGIKVGDKITVLDETPFIVLDAEPNVFYELVIYDTNEILIGRQGVQADPNGLLKMEVLPYLNYETYSLYVLNPQHEIYEIFTIEIEDRKYRIHETININEEITREAVCLGRFKKSEINELTGKGKSDNTYYAYFQSLAKKDKNKINPVYVIKTIADNSGYYKIQIPDFLEAEIYHIDIVQIYEDGKISRNIRYIIDLTEEKNIFCVWVLISILAITVLGQFSRIKKLKNKKRNGFTIRMLAVFLVMFIIGYQSSFVMGAVTTPGVFIYEGKLLNSANNPITTPQTFRFSLWSSSDFVPSDLLAGGAINTLAPNYGGWQEAQTITPNIDGTFFFKLGSVNPLPNMDLSLHRFLQVEIKSSGTPDTSYELMDPTGDNGADTEDRQTIGSAPYANNADFLDYAEIGTSAGDIALLDTGGIWNINFMPDGTNFDTFIIDYDDTSIGDIVLQFGNLLGAFLKFDIINNWFEFSNNINLAQNEIKNFAIDNLAVAPATPVAGQMYYNTTDGNTYIWNGLVWEDITAAAGGADLDTVYTADADKTMNVDNPLGLIFSSTTAGDIVFDLQSTGDVVMQTGGTPFVTFTDGGSVGIGTTTPSTILDVNSGSANTTPIFTLGNSAGDVQMFRADATPEGNITGSIGDITIDGTGGNIYIKNSGNSTNTGWLQFGGQKVKEAVFKAEYADAVAEADGTNNRGTLVSRFIDNGGTSKFNFYEWVTTRPTMQNIDLVVSFKLPMDFVSFTANPLKILYNTGDGNIVNNKLDIALYDTTGAVVTITGGSNLANASWTNANMTFGGAPTFTAGGTITLVIKLSAINTGFARTADVIFEYNSS